MTNLDQNVGGPTPLGLLLLISMIGLTWALPRRIALIPLLLTVCYIPLGQAFVIAGANIQFFRLLLLVAWIRILSRGERSDFEFTRMDKVFVWWLVVTLVIGSFTQPSEFGSRFVSRVGEVYNAGATYFLIRCWLRNIDEYVNLLRRMAFLLLPMTGIMILEKVTGRNLFYVFGGVPEMSVIRDGSVRAQGAFRNPLLAGVFGATSFPLFIGLIFREKKLCVKGVVGALCSVIIAVAAKSSGSMLALMGAAIGLFFWRFRHSMQSVRRSILFIIAALGATMKAPVWYIFARVSDLAGGSGWYRSFLIEQAVNNFTQWCFLGTLYTANWAPAGEIPEGNPNNTDIINQFVLEGVQGGLFKVLLFTGLIIVGFKNVGRFTRIPLDLPFSYRFTIWSLGVSLLAHCLSFFSVTYFDQIVIMWYFLLAALAMLQIEYRRIQTDQQPVSEPVAEKMESLGHRLGL